MKHNMWNVYVLVNCPYSTLIMREDRAQIIIEGSEIDAASILEVPYRATD
jgi:hypothetical protein